MSDNSPNLLYFVRGNTCFLLNHGDQAIAELEFTNGSYAFDRGCVVGDDYGRYRVRDFAPKTFFEVYELTQDDIIYLPRARWFQLDIHRCVRADGFASKKFNLKSVDKYGGYQPEAQFVELPMEEVAEKPQ